MSYPYFFINPVTDKAEGDRLKVAGEDLDHLKNVLRKKVGDIVYVSDSTSYRYKTEIINIGRSEAILLVKDKSVITRKIPKLSLFQCILKKNAMEFVIQKSTEIGVDRIIPVISSRVITNKKKIAGKISRWQKISDQASKQCKRDFRCEILPAESIYDIKISDYSLFYIPYEKYFGSDENLEKINEVASIGYIIGPEGGFGTDEVNFLKGKGAKEINFGGNIFRSETAAIYFLSVLDYLVRD